MKNQQSPNSYRLVSSKLVISAAVFALLVLPISSRAGDSETPSLPSPLCDSLQVPEGNSVAFHAFAIGVQIYRWDGTKWVFIAPSAKLYADPGYHGQVGTHYAGPT